MTGFTLLLLGAAVGFALSRRFSIPVIPFLMIAGALLSFLDVAPPDEMRRRALDLGLTVLAFSVGLELNPQRFGAQKRAVFWVGTVQMLSAGALGYLLSRLIGFGPTESLYAAFTLSASSTLVVIRHLKQQQQMFEPFGRLVIGVLLLQDVLMILVIVVLSRMSGGPVAIAEGLIWLSALLVLAFVCQRRILPAMITRWNLDEETLLLGVLAVLFVFVGISFNVGIPLVSGAFLGGFALSAFPVNGVVRGLISSVSDFFLALFFVALGAILTIPSGSYLLYAMLLAVFVVVITPPLVTALAEWKGLTARAAIESGLYLAQTSEFSLVAVLVGLELGHVSADMFSLLAIVTVVSMTITPFIATDTVTRRLLRLHPLHRDRAMRGDLRDHVLVLGFGAGGMWVIRPLMTAGHRILVVDDDPAVIEQLRKQRIPCIRGDGSDERTLERASARRAKLIIAGMRRVSDSRKVIGYAAGVPVVVRLFEHQDAEQVRALGGIPILNSIAAADTFMDWFNAIEEERADGAEVSGRGAGF